MQVVIVQFPILSKNKQGNIDQIEKLLVNIKADLIVLPEMFNTGFFTDDISLAEEMNGPTLNWMLDFSEKSQNAVCGSLLCKESNIIFNRFLMVNKGEIVGHYDKIHLFSMSKEHETVTAGNTKVDVVINGWKIRPIICYDLRFPYTTFNDSAYDLLINVASWPSQRITHWDSLLQARAIENQAYVIGCNRVGEQTIGNGENIFYPGHSSVYLPDGKILAHAVKEEVIRVVLDKQILQDTRTRLPFLQDRRL